MRPDCAQYSNVRRRHFEDPLGVCAVEEVKPPACGGLFGQARANRRVDSVEIVV